MERRTERTSTTNQRPADGEGNQLIEVFSQAVGRTRFVVLFAVGAVLLVAISLFLQGTIQAAMVIWHSWSAAFRAQAGSPEVTIEVLEIVTIMLKAVVFYLVGIGLYGLFIAPLNLTVLLGVETLSDLEDKVLSVVIVIMSTTFLEHFIRWQNALEVLEFGVALAVVIIALVLFQRHSLQVKIAQSTQTQARARRELFERDHERYQVSADEVSEDRQSQSN
jgi:uncharacterized membrane protein YqhA